MTIAMQSTNETASGARIAQLERNEKNGTLSEFGAAELAELRGYDPADGDTVADFVCDSEPAPKVEKPKRARTAKRTPVEPVNPRDKEIRICRNVVTGVCEEVVSDEEERDAKARVLADPASYQLIQGRLIVPVVTWE